MPHRLCLLTMLWASLCASACAAQSPATQPRQTQPDPVGQTLTRIEQTARSIDTLTARLRYDRIQGVLGDEQRRVGTLTYQAGEPARFRIDFTRLILDDAAREQQRSWIFDGRWLAEVDAQARTFTRRQLVADQPHAQNKPRADLTAGPFALPLDFDKADILKRFDVTLLDDQPRTIHLQLVPKAHLQLDEKQIDLWYDAQTCHPVKAASLDHAENESIFLLRDVTINVPVKPSVFDTTPPTSGWTVEIKPIER